MAKKKRSNRSKAKPANPASDDVKVGDPATAERKTRKRSRADTDRGDANERKPRLPDARVAKIGSAPAEEPTFWFGFEVPWAKLVVARVVLFGLLALDAILQIPHAPRYGASDFNVAQLEVLDHLGPGRVAYGVCQLLISFLLTCAALGAATRLVLPIATALYAWLYFGSQLDSYQHHYLVALVLAISCFVPWQRRDPVAPSSPIRSWALRLLLVQLGIMYLWAAVSKLDPAWLDGTTLGSQITGGMKSMIEGTIGFKAASILVIAVELALAFTVWLRPAWKIAAPLGLAFHLGIVATGFEIGLFAYVMCALYILVIPDRIWIAAAEIPAVRSLGGLGRKLVGDRRPMTIAFAVALVVGVPLWIFNRLPHALGVGIAAAVFISLVALYRRVRRALPQPALPWALLATILLWTVTDRATNVAIDYYRFWGGSQRRIGDRDQAEAAYRGMLRIDASSEIAHFYLGRILLATGRDAEGIDHLQQAQYAEPTRARAFLEEARWLLRQGKRDAALDRAKEAAMRAPDDLEARAFLDSLQKKGSAPTPKAEDDGER